MKKDIYKAIRANGFSSKGQNPVSNKGRGIKRCFSDKAGRYIQIYKEEHGFSVFIYGDGFMNGHFPWNCDILFKKDIDHLRTKIETTIG